MPSDSPVNISEILTKGGEQRIALLRYCAMSATMEPVFVFLTREYRFRPTHVAALALYDVFCSPAAPARLRALHVLPPRDLRLTAAIQCIRQQWAQCQCPEQPDADGAVSITTPHKHLFDAVANALQDDPQGRFAQLSRRFDPGLTPQQNLPGGRMNAGQRHFLENIWRPAARPRLVSAGFWQIASIE